MSMKMEFLLKAIEEVQETNRFLDTKAGVVVVFESSLLVMVATSLMDKSVLELVSSIAQSTSKGYFIFLVIYIAFYLAALIGHILHTLKVIFPQEAPNQHVDIAEFEPQNLFYLYQLNKKDIIQPSVMKYSEKLSEMDSDDIINELIYELMKLSYIRKKKNDRLAFSYRFLGILIVSLVLFGILIAVS